MALLRVDGRLGDPPPHREKGCKIAKTNAHRCFCCLPALLNLVLLFLHGHKMALCPALYTAFHGPNSSSLPSPLSPLSHHEKRGKKAGTNQKTNESTNEPTNQPTNGIEPIKRTNEPTNQPTNRITPNPTEPKQTKFNHATHQIASNQTNQPTNKQINE